MGSGCSFTMDCGEEGGVAGERGQTRKKCGEWTYRVWVSGHHVVVCIGDSAHTGIFPQEIPKELCSCIICLGAVLALGEMVYVLRCEDILLGSSFVKKREVLIAGQWVQETKSVQAMLLKIQHMCILDCLTRPPYTDSVAV